MAGAFSCPFLVAINHKNLDYEIETLTRITIPRACLTTINHKNLDYEIETLLLRQVS